MKIFRILGCVIDRTTQHGIKGLRVEAWDKDLIVSDLLGSTTTSEDGTFQIQFDESYFKELFLDRRPDLFFKVYKKDELLKSTQDSVLWNITVGETQVTIEIDKEDNMPNGKELQLPVEIPWKLASTTQELKEGGPHDTTISVFYYEPELESLETDYPDERLIYLKFIVSVSPYQPDEASFGELARYLLEGGLPVWHTLLDLKVVAKGLSYIGAIRPYFHAAAPTHRSMIETGVIGADAFEGEASEMAIGKSGSQLHETLASNITTKSESGGFNAIVLSGSFRKTSTTIDSERTVDQHVETTSREASQERRELLSHMSNVENVLTLLTAKHVGSPYLRFNLSPRPLHTLSLDPSDPNLWYHQLLNRRSSGIEGMQEFFAVLAVPKDMEGFIVNATLRRVCVLDNPPVYQVPYSEEEVVEYLERLYPRGTLIDELDVDLQIDNDKYPRPVVLGWYFYSPSGMFNDYVKLLYVSPPAPGDIGDAGLANYKCGEEVWLEMYEQDLARSPLERGVVLEQSIELDTSFSLEDGDNGIKVTGHTTRNLPAVELSFEPSVQPTPPHIRRNRGFASTPYQHVHTVTSWNLLEGQLMNHLKNLKTFPEVPISPSSPRVLQYFLDLWKGLAPEDPRNLPLSEVSSMLKLSEAQTHLLADAGVNDLRGIAQVIISAPKIPKMNKKIEELSAQLPKEEAEKLRPLELPIPQEEVDKIRQQISKAFQPVLPDKGH